MDEIIEAKTDPVVTRIEQICATLLPDQKRVRATVVLNHASARPTVELFLLDHQQQEITHSTIIGMFVDTINFTLHLGSHNADSEMYLRGTVIVNDTEVLDEKQVAVESNK